MNILLIFATNSGTTQTVADMIKDDLTAAGHSVTEKQVSETTSDDIANAEGVILGSPSWDFEGKEGQPHEDYVPFIEKLKGKTYPTKPFAIFGLGDSSYRYFCGAVDHLEELVKTLQGSLITPSLRIDNFYSDMNGNTQKVKQWTEELKKNI